MVKTDFLTYSAKDFLLDESFQNEIIAEGNHPVEVWPEWLTEHPEKRTPLEQAQLIAVQLRSQLEEDIVEGDIDEVWMRIEESIDSVPMKQR